MQILNMLNSESSFGYFFCDTDENGASKVAHFMDYDDLCDFAVLVTNKVSGNKGLTAFKPISRKRRMVVNPARRWKRRGGANSNLVDPGVGGCAGESGVGR